MSIVSALKNLTEALEDFDRKDARYPLAAGIHQKRIVAAARVLSGFVSTCPTCEGSGLEADHGKGWTCDGDCCPDCRGGLVLNPEAVERAVRGFWDGELSGTIHDDDRRRTSDALWAALDTGDTE
jgi:hypothetical protein